ncbi:MAG TPA: tetratricopeptide repeat protein, partial [Phaeodactylibacter sp.]|nr:tetratricopeptide repeat protein [Phaeodactylibacter sp.]
MNKNYFVFVFLFVSNLVVGNHFEFTPLATEAYHKVMSLQFEEARVDIETIKREDPENSIVYFIENYIDFFTVFINEDKSEFKRLEKNKIPRLRQIRKGNRDSPYYLYCQAEMKLQWALARLKFEQYFNAFNEVSSAYQLLQRNQKKFPDFIANKKSLG